MKSITIVSDDKVGLLADISYVLAKTKINIDSLSVDVVGGKAVVGMTLSDPIKGKEVLESAGYKIEDIDAVVIKLTDEPGELNKITTMLSKEGINIKNVHMVAKDSGHTVLAVVVDKPRKTMTLLKEYVISKD